MLEPAASPTASPLRLVVMGAGDRGNVYAKLAAAHALPIQIVGVAEPRSMRRAAFAELYEIAPEHAFDDWSDLLAAIAAGTLAADAAVIATPDRVHEDPAITAAELGLHLLLEKPMAPDAAGCERIAAAVNAAGVQLAVGHVLRYTPYTRALMAELASGVIGELVSIQHLEPVGHWHMAHSFVRGNWRNEAGSAPMLLAKSCHDIDWLCHLVGRPCERVSSFGSLKHFRPEARPEGAADRCTDCPDAVESACPYSALRIYGRFLERGPKDGSAGWPLAVLDPNPTPASIDAALRTGPYGRCVYACDNDVVDHQVVAMEFEGGVTVNFTMTAFAGGGRTTRIFGTHGEIFGDSATIRVTDFLSGDARTVTPPPSESGHGGGDAGLFDAFVRTLAGEPNQISSGASETLASHRLVFEAEKARRSGQVVRCKGSTS